MVKRAESHPPATRDNGAAYKEQVISLVAELNQKKEAAEAALRKYDMLKTQTEMEESKTKSQVIRDEC